MPYMIHGWTLPSTGSTTVISYPATPVSLNETPFQFMVLDVYKTSISAVEKLVADRIMVTRTSQSLKMTYSQGHVAYFGRYRNVETRL